MGMQGNPLRSDLLQELINGVELAGDGEGFEDGVVGGGGVGEARLLRSPVEEAESKRVVVEEEGVDNSGDEGWVE